MTEITAPSGEKLSKLERWTHELGNAREEFDSWLKRCDKILKRYKDESEHSGNAQVDRRFNILWSNHQTQKPALYSRTPRPQVERRFKDRDPVGRVASQILERALTFTLDAYNFDGVMRPCVDDLILFSRGVAKVLYRPTFVNKRIQVFPQQTESGIVLIDELGQDAEAVGAKIQEDESGIYYLQEDLDYEEALCDYVPWYDFLHSPAPRWSDVRWVGFRHYLHFEDVKARFGKKIADNLNYGDSNKGEVDGDDIGPQHQPWKRAQIWEIWNKDEKKQLFVSEGYEKVLEENDDPLKLREFFPCPKPLYGTTTTDSLVPIPDYAQYQHQAQQLDHITERIGVVLQAIKVVGVCPANFEEAEQLLEASTDNQIIPIRNWNALAEKGGLRNVIQFIPIQEAAQVLMQLYQAQDRELQSIYQISGMSDIVRGASDPRETAKAQQIKGEFATLRFSDKQKEVQRFAKDLLALKGEIIGEKFDPQTIRSMSGVDFIDSPEPQQTFEQAVQLLRQDVTRVYRIDIETDSTISTDEALDKQKATEYLQALGGFMQQGLPITQQMPELLPYFKESLLFLGRRFSAGRNLEAQLEMSFEALEKRVTQMMQQPQQPGPEQIAMQMKQQELQFKAQIEQEKLKQKQRELELKAEESAAKSEIEGIKADVQRQKLMLETGVTASEEERNNVRLKLEQQEQEFKRFLETQNLELEKLKVEIQAAETLAEKEAKMAEHYNNLQQSANETLDNMARLIEAQNKEQPPINVEVKMPKPGKKTGKLSRDEFGNATIEVLES